MTEREKLERLIEQKQRALKVQRGFQESVYCDRCRCCWDEDEPRICSTED
jgi:hypothetical protein